MAAGLPWIKVDVGMPDHPKVRALAIELGLDRATACGHLIVLWTSCGRLAPSGGLPAPHADLVLEQMAGWSGEQGRFAAACVACRLVDRTETGLEVHDWEDHAGAFVERYRKDAARKKKARKSAKCPMDVQRTSDARPADVLREREREREIEKKLSPASPVASKKVEEQPTPKKPSAQQTIVATLAAARHAAHPDLQPWECDTAAAAKKANALFAAGKDIRAAHDKDPALFLKAFALYLADPYWRTAGGWPLGGFIGGGKWRELLDSVKALEPSDLFKNAIEPGASFPDPYAEEGMCQ